MRNWNETAIETVTDLGGLTLMLRCYDVWSATDTAECACALGQAVDPKTGGR